MKELNEYEQRQQERRERYQERAEQLDAESTHLWSTSFGEEHTGIPLGQPILVGHHSEKRHRAHLARLDRQADKAVELGRKAKHYAAKAEAVGTGGISSLDPDAIEKLQVQLAQRRQAQENMKAENAAARKAKEEAPYPSWALQNNNAQIRRIAERIKELEQARALCAQEGGQEVVTDNYACKYEDGYIKFIFDGKPEEAVRSALKRSAFKWSPRNMAWVRKLTANASYAAKCVRKELDAIFAEE